MTGVPGHLRSPAPLDGQGLQLTARHAAGTPETSAELQNETTFPNVHRPPQQRD